MGVKSTVAGILIAFLIIVVIIIVVGAIAAVAVYDQYKQEEVKKKQLWMDNNYPDRGIKCGWWEKQSKVACD